MRRAALIVTLVFLVVASMASAASARRFSGYVAGTATGAGHHFVVGDGLFLVFVDARRSSTPYRVCWHQLHHSQRRCWTGVTGAAGAKDRIFAAAPGAAGTFLVKWTVDHHRKATWRFVNGVGD